MASVIHARLDDDTDALRNDLQSQLGWSDSQIVREGIKSLSSLVQKAGKRKIVGLGKFKSDVSDLGSNKKHLKGFGK
jgi:ppGpp synthetase/RelA/SpoT-type nucleotidyltranferase